MINKVKTVQFRALSPCKCEELGIDAQEGDIVDIEYGYAAPRRAFNGSRLNAIVQDLCPQLVPNDPTWKEQVYDLPGVELIPTKNKNPNAGIDIEALVRSGVPRGVAETLAQAASAARSTAGNNGPEAADKPSRKPTKQ